MAQESVLRIIIDSRNAERNARAVAGELDNLTKKGDQAETQMTAMSASIKSLVGYMGGILTINKAIAMADGYTQMAARIRNATKDAAEYDLVQSRILATANTTYRQLGEAQEVYLSMAGGMKSLGYQTTQTLDLVDSLSFSFTHNATRTDQAQSAMDSLSKSMAKGKIDADAWISIVTGADNVIADMAKTTGKSEAEIRKLGAEGKASLSDLIKTLIATRDENEKLANNMENSLADGFTKLSNEVTVYLGKANEATSATGILAGGLSGLADNLEVVANTGAVLGIGYVTSALLTKGAAVKAGLALSAQKRIADQAEAVSQTQLTAAEVRRTASIAQYTQMQLADARATAARMTGMQRLAYVQSTVIPLEAKATQATAAHTAATNIDTAAQELNNKARSRGAMLLGLVGGPIGAITLGVTALAAGYAYMSYRTSEANAKLEEQAAVAKKAKDELLALKGLEKDNAVNDMAAAFERQNAALSESSSKINMQLNAIEQLYKGNKEVVQVVQDARNGTISMTEAVQRFNELRIGKEVYEAIKANTVEFEKNAKEATNTKTKLSLFGYEVELSGRKAQTAAVGVDEDSKALGRNKTAAEEAAEAQKKFKASLFDREFEARLTKGLLAKGYTPEQVANMVQTANWAQKNNVKLTNELYQAGLQVLSIEEQNKKVIESRNAAEKERTKELEKQQKVLQVNAKVQALAAKYNISAKETANNIPKGLISAMIMQESRGDTYRNGKLLTSPAGAQGVGQFMPGTAKQYGVDVRSEESSINGMIKMMSALIKQFGGDVDKAIMAYNAGPGNVQNGRAYSFKETKNYLSNVKGYMAGSTGFKQGDISSKEFDRILEESTRVAIEQAKARTQLEVEVSSEVEKIRANLQEKLSEIDAANFTPEKAKELKAEYQTRADNDIAIAEYALKTKLDDYESFRKTESQLLEDSFNERKFYASRDLELTKEQRDKAVALLDEQLKQEQALMKLAYETRLFQMREQFLNETVAMEQRYDLEHRKLIEIKDVKEREYKAEMLRLQKMSEIQQRLKNASQNWASIQADMNGTSELLRLSDERDYRAQQSGELADAEYQSLAQKAQDPNANMEELAAQREAIWQAHHDRMTAIESDYQASSYSLQLGYGQQVTGALSGMFGAMLGESSSAYRALYAAQQAFALAQAGMNVWKAASDAYANEPGTVWQKMGAAALATIESGTFVTMIQAATPKGFANGGYTGHGGKYDPAGIVHKGEGVLTQEEVKALGGPQGFEDLRKSIRRGYATGGLVADTHRVGMGAVSAINSGGGNGGGSSGDVNITVNVTDSGVTTQSNQSDQKQLGQMIGNAVRTVIRQEQRQGGLLAK